MLLLNLPKKQPPGLKKSSVKLLCLLVSPKICTQQQAPCLICVAVVGMIDYNFTLQDEADGSNEYNNFQRGSLNTTYQLFKDLKNIDIVFHIGDICYAEGYISQWDQFTAQVEPIASSVPYMIARFVLVFPPPSSSWPRVLANDEITVFQIVNGFWSELSCLGINLLVDVTIWIPELSRFF